MRDGEENVHGDLDWVVLGVCEMPKKHGDSETYTEMLVRAERTPHDEDDQRDAVTGGARGQTPLETTMQ